MRLLHMLVAAIGALTALALPSVARGAGDTKAKGDSGLGVSEDCSGLMSGQEFCDCVRRKASDAYVVIFREQEGRFDYPPGGAALEDQEIVLCIDTRNLWNRYRLVFGRSRVGEIMSSATAQTSVGYAPGLAPSTALGSAVGSFDMSIDCKNAGELRDDCDLLITDIKGILEAIRAVAGIRDMLAQFLVEKSQRPLRAADIESMKSLAYALCIRQSGDDAEGMEGDDDTSDAVVFPQGNIKFELPQETSGGYHPITGCRLAATIGLAINDLLPQSIRWADGQWSFVRTPRLDFSFRVRPPSTAEPEPPNTEESPPPEQSPAPISTPASTPSSPAGTPAPPSTKKKAPAPAGVAKDVAEEPNQLLNRLKEERVRLLSVLQGAMKGYDELFALAMRLVEDSVRQSHVFRIGRFDGNTIIAATLEQYDVSLGYAAQRDRVVYESKSALHELNISVKKLSWFQIQVGFAASTLTDPSFELKPVAMMSQGEPTVENHVTRASEGNILAPATFVSILWCAQDLGRTLYERRCASGRSWRRYLPAIAVGVPLNSAFGNNLYVGLSFPHIPYTAVVVGTHIGYVTRLRDDVDTSMPVAATDVKDITQEHLKWGAFIALTFTSEILDLLRPTTRPAQ